MPKCCFGHQNNHTHTHTQNAYNTNYKHTHKTSHLYHDSKAADNGGNWSMERSVNATAGHIP